MVGLLAPGLGVWQLFVTTPGLRDASLPGCRIHAAVIHPINSILVLVPQNITQKANIVMFIRYFF